MMVDRTAPNVRRHPYEHHEYLRDWVEARENGTRLPEKSPQLILPREYWLPKGPWTGLFIATGVVANQGIPRPPALQSTPHYSPWHGFNLRWGTDETFYTAFVPEANPFADPVFEPLVTHRWKIVTVKTERPASKGQTKRTKTGPAATELPDLELTYGLSPETVHEWQCLEGVLIQAVRAVTQWGNLLLPSDYVSPPMPSVYGYHRLYASPKIAKKVVQNARAAFVLWGALLSYQIARLERDTLPMPVLKSQTQADWPGVTPMACEEVWPDGIQPVSESWHRQMELAGIITPDLTALLKSSWICDFRRRRIGCFIDLTSDRKLAWLSDVRHITRVAYLCITFWFYYGEYPERCLTLHLPRALYEVTLASLLVKAERDRAACTHVNTTPWKFDTAMQPEGDRVEKHATGSAVSADAPQRPNLAAGDDSALPWRAHGRGALETSQADSDSPSASHTDAAAPEPNAHTRQRRGEDIFAFMAREKAYNEERIAKETAAQRERRLKREAEEQAKPYPTRKGPAVYHWIKVRDYWLRERVSTKCYRALWQDTKEIHRVYNSVRHEWDVSLLFDPDDEARKDDSFEGWDQLVPNLYEDDFADIDDPYDDSVGGHVLPEAQRALAGEGILVWRDGDPCAQHADPEPEQLLDVLAGRYGVMVQLPYVAMSREDGERVLRAPTVLRMLAHMTAAGVFSGPELPAICDFVTGITEGSPAPLLSDLSPTNGRHPALLSRIGERIKAEDSGTYLVEPAGGGHRQGWLLTVGTATDAVEIARRWWGRDRDGLAEEMIRRGIPFSTLAHTARLPSPPITTQHQAGSPWSGLGYREPGYRPTALDYALYERQRRAVLGRPHGRSALMRGGIVWRLAYEDVDPQSVLFGPSDSEQKQIKLRGGGAYEDDSLSEEELFVICGVYHIYSDKKEKSASDSSWWPKESTWRESGMNVGYWTRQNEEWFIARRGALEDAVRTGDTARMKLRTAQEWRKALRYEAIRSGQFHDKVEALACAAIRG